ncbi:MAG: c-type cytochrome [Byssovorax sp.]
MHRSRPLLGSVLPLLLAFAGCSSSAPPPATVPPAPAAATVTAPGCQRLAAQPAFAPVGEHRQSGAIALARFGARLVAFVADEDAKALVAYDIERRAELASTPLHGAPGQVLLTEDGRAIVTLREAGKVAVFEPTAPEKPLDLRCTAETASEPIALGVSPDQGTLLVTSGFGHALTAFDARDLALRYEVDLPREPRAIVIGDDGKTAFVSHAVGARLSAIDLTAGAHAVKDIALMGNLAPVRSPDRSTTSTCQGYALVRSVEPRGRLLAPEVLVTPGDPEQRAAGYGDENAPTEQPSVAVIDEGTGEPLGASLRTGQGQIMLEDLRGGPSARHRSECLLPRAAAVDPASRTLLVACLGIDAVIAYDASAASPADAELRRFEVGAGPAGIAVDDASRRAVVWSQFDRALSLIPLDGADPMRELASGPAAPERLVLTPTTMSHEVAVGRQLFHAVNDGRISADGRACASCHPDGRDDALIWATPDGPRRTLMLAGRLDGTAPYGWSGNGKSLKEHVGHTFARLNGSGLRGAELDSLLAYVQSLRPPTTGRAAHAPSSADGAAKDEAAQIARGAAVFRSAEAGCASCHRDEGKAARFTDNLVHDIGTRARADREGGFDTPSLRFVAARAPYFHDGRYATLRAVIRSNEKMGSTKHLSEADLVALEAYLRSL